MDEALLIPSRTTSFRPTPSTTRYALDHYLTPAGNSDKLQVDRNEKVKNPEDVLKVLQSQPDSEALTKCLEWLIGNATSLNAIDIRFPSAQAAQVVNVLVNDIVPHHWHVWSGSDSHTHKRQRTLLLQCLTSVAGIGAIVARLRVLSSSSRDARATAKLPGQQFPVTQIIDDLVDFSEALLRKDNVADRIWTAIYISPDTHTLYWKESVSLLATGRLVSAVAEAQNLPRLGSSREVQKSWLGNGLLYSAWLGRNIYYMLAQENPNFTRKRKAVPQLLSKALTLGYTDQVVDGVFAQVLAGEAEHMGMLRATVSDLASYEQKNVLYTLLHLATKRALSIPDTLSSIGGTAALLEYLVIMDPYLQEALLDWLTGAHINGFSIEMYSRRAVLAAMSPYPGKQNPLP